MHKSDYKIIIPYSDYRSFVEMESDFSRLKCELAECFDSQVFNADGVSPIHFDREKALQICRRFIPYRLKDADIE